MEDKKESYGKRVGKNVSSFLNRVNRGVNEDTEARNLDMDLVRWIAENLNF